MKQKLPIVAIVGQTNAGKSALFNRIVGSQDAIVAREEGTTRDAVVRVVYGKAPFTLVDTAGLKAPEDDFEATIQEQIEDAIDSADLILLVKDRTAPVLHADRDIARKALKSRKPVLLVLNKSDLKEKLPAEEFLALGIRDILEVSAEHNTGISQLVKSINTKLPFARSDLAKTEVMGGIDTESETSLAGDTRGGRLGLAPQSAPSSASGELASTSKKTPLKIALIGRPNVGKSHLFNALAGKQQAIVAPVAGTTRDINRSRVRYHSRPIEILDTAGVRRRGKIEQGVEKFSVLRTVAAIEEADICLLLMDVDELNTALDQSLAGMITEAGKGIIIVVTKWDNFENTRTGSSSDVPEGALESNSKAFPADVPEGALEAARPSLPPQVSSAGNALPSVADKLSNPARNTSEILHQISQSFDFIPYAPVILTSAVTGRNVTKIFELALEIDQRRRQKLATRQLNTVLQQAVLSHPPAGLKNTHPKFRYMVQTDISPPWFVIYGANFKFIHWSYKRYLERQLREKFDLIGTPIRFSFRDEKQIRANKLSGPKPE